MITDFTIRKSALDKLIGWCFDVYFDDREYPNTISGLYTTKAKAMAAYRKYEKTGKIEIYGDAE